MTCARTHPSERRGMPSAMGRANPVVYIHVRTYSTMPVNRRGGPACLTTARARALLVRSGRLALRRGLRAPNGPYISTLTSEPFLRRRSAGADRVRSVFIASFRRGNSRRNLYQSSRGDFFGARKCGGNAGGIKKRRPRARVRPLAAAALHPRVRHTVPRSRSTSTRPAARPCPTRRRARERARARAPRGLPRWTRAPVVRPAASCACT